jgi:hypothetical protein
MPGRAIFAIVMGAVVVCTVAGCGGGGNKSAPITATSHSAGSTPMPPIYPGTTVSIPPSDPSSTPSSVSAPTSTKPPGPATSFSGDGTFRVGVDIQAGTYRSEGGAACYWERLRGLSGAIEDMITNGVAGPPVQILPSDVAFKTQACGSWSLASSGTTTTATTPPAVLPSGAQVCPTTTGSSGGFTQSATGNSDTSCPFAEQIRLAYGASGSPSSVPRQIAAVSPTTNRSYTMSCAANGRLVTCTGGDGAVIYLY